MVTRRNCRLVFRPAITVAAPPAFAFQFVRSRVNAVDPECPSRTERRWVQRQPARSRTPFQGVSKLAGRRLDAATRRFNLASTMASKTPPAASAAKKQRDPDRFGNAGPTLDPWEECARLSYGGDRSYAWTVRTQVIATPPEGRAGIEERLLKACALPGRTEAGLAFLCQMLALVGTAKSVPTLVPLLRDPKTAESARYALEPITGPEADAALRDALGILTGAVKAGVIGSIAVRGDTAARPALAALKDAASEPAVVRDAAVRALALLANPKSRTR